MSAAEAAVTGDGSRRRPHDEQAAAFRAFFHDHYAGLVRYLHGICRDRGVAEEAALDAFVIAHRKWSVISHFEEPQHWVRKAAYFELRKVLDRRPPEIVGFEEELACSAEPTNPAEARAILDRLFGGLPERERAVMLLVLEGCKNEVIASELGLASATVRTYKANAMKKLRTMLQRREGGLG